MAQVLFVYELSNLFVLSAIGFIFRPREHSPFFLMIPATIQDDRTRPIPMIEGTDDEDCKAEVELQPLLNRREGNENTHETSAIHTIKLMFVRNPNNSVNVGISPSPGHFLGERPPIQPSTQASTNRHNSRNNNRIVVPTNGNNNGNNTTVGSPGRVGTRGNNGQVLENAVEMGMLANHP